MAEQSFESSMKELGDIVNQLEEGNIELDNALTLFEKGIKLSKELSVKLDKAEQKVTKLTADQSGTPCEELFDDLNNQ